MSPTSTPIQVLTVDSLAWLVTSTLRRPRADLALPPSAAAWPRRQPAAARVAHDSCADEFGSASYGGPRRRAAGLVDQLLVVEAAPQRWLVRWCTQRPRPRRARLPCGTSDPAGPGVRNFVGGAMDSNSFPRPTHNVRRPRKHCVSDTPHAPARAPRDAHARARPALGARPCATAPSSKVHPIAAAERPRLHALARLHRARHRHRRLGYTASRASLPALGPPTAVRQQVGLGEESLVVVRGTDDVGERARLIGIPRDDAGPARPCSELPRDHLGVFTEGPCL